MQDQQQGAIQVNPNKPNSQVLKDLHYLEPLMKKLVTKGISLQEKRRQKKQTTLSKKQQLLLSGSKLNSRKKKEEEKGKEKTKRKGKGNQKMNVISSTLISNPLRDYIMEEESRTRLCIRLHPSETKPEVAVRVTDDQEVVKYKTSAEGGLNIRQLARSIGWFLSGEMEEVRDENQMSKKGGGEENSGSGGMKEGSVSGGEKAKGGKFTSTTENKKKTTEDLSLSTITTSTSSSSGKNKKKKKNKK